MAVSTLSIVVPVLNEDRLPHFLDATRRVLRSHVDAVEFIIVDDGNPDSDPYLGEGTRIIRGSRRGKGRAVRDGVLASTGDVVAILDADVDMLLGFLPRFVELVRNGGYDVVIAERQFDRHARQPLRFVLSYGLYVLQRVFVFNSRRFRDTQCGFKTFKGDVARRIAKLQRVDGGMYDIEYLYIAVTNRLGIAQVSVGAPRESRRSRIRLWKCLRTDPFDLLAIKLRGVARRYRLTA